MSRKGTVTIERNGHTLVITISAGGCRFFSCASFPDLAAKYDGTRDSGDCISEFEARATAAPPAPDAPARQPDLLDFLAAPTLDDNAPHLARVRGRIGAAVLAFLRARLAAGAPEFAMAELLEYVTRETGVAPDSPGRILRDARQRGCCRYDVVNRAKSKYRVVSVKPEDSSEAA